MTAQDLKNSILQLAVQGKLVPQCKEDEPASELISQIISFRNKNEKKTIKSLSPISEDEIVYDIPESWIWLKLGEFCQVYNGNSINANVKQEKYSKKCDGYSFIATKDVGFDHVVDYENGIYIPKEETEFKVAVNGSILLCMEGGSAGKKIGIINRDVCFGNKLCCFSPCVVFNRYLYYYLQSPSFFSAFFGSMTGLIGGVGSAKLKDLVCPIPPLAEQKRIVAKIEELLPMVEKYGKAQEQLATLNAKFPDKLRKSILQQAVQGKLTERDPSDEPASELIKRIKEERYALQKNKLVKNSLATDLIEVDEVPFDIPDNWTWVKLGWICQKIGAGSTPKGGSSVYVKEGIKFLREQNIHDDGLRLSDVAFIDEKTHNAKSGSKVEAKDILMNITGGSIGRNSLVPDDFDTANINQHVLIIRLVNKEMRHYLHYCFLSPTILNQMFENQAGDKPGLSATKVENFLIPVPPLAEQKRIVKRVDELLALCEGLK